MENLNTATSQAIREQSDTLAQSIVEIQYGMQPGTWHTFGLEGRKKSLRDAGFHLAYLSEAIASSEPILFSNYIAYVKVLFENLGFSPNVISKTLEATRLTMQQKLPLQQAALVKEYLAAGENSLSQNPAPLPLFINPSLPLGGLAKDYLDALLDSNRHSANQLILNAVAHGTSIKDIYLHVFQRTQYEIGKLWQTNHISVAQEHFCTAATQSTMSQLYPHIFRTERINRRLVATCAGSELHEIGMRMVADFFEMEGWDTYYLGANMPAAGIIKALNERKAHVLGISATITFHIREVAELIALVRASEDCQDVIILVGGYPFLVSENLWKTVGADGFGANAQQAIDVANALVSQ